MDYAEISINIIKQRHNKPVVINKNSKHPKKPISPGPTKKIILIKSSKTTKKPITSPKVIKQCGTG